MKIALIGGLWGSVLKRSSLVEKIAISIKNFISEFNIKEFYYENGGIYSELKDILSKLSKYDIVLWFPNISNEYEKVRNVKELFPKIILVTSKRNIDNKYNVQDLVSHSLMLKSNLLLEFSKKSSEKIYNGRLLDPLGNMWCDYTTDFDKIIKSLLSRVKFLLSITREGTNQMPDFINLPSPPDINGFYDIIKYCADKFHNMNKPAKHVTRFLGNSSFRCLRGFPSFKIGDYIYVSKRNVDKRYIDQNAFVLVRFDSKRKIWYSGENKPSVDTPIQLRLYEFYKNINYMLHSHVYIENAPFTKKAIPCGAIEEYSEIINIIPNNNSTNFCINLINHGSIILAQYPEYITSVKFINRNIPEHTEI